MNETVSGEFLCICALLFSQFTFHSQLLCFWLSFRAASQLVVPEHSGRSFSLSRSYPRCVSEETPRAPVVGPSVAFD